MKKKIIVPAVLCVALLIWVIATLCGGPDKVRLEYEPVPVDTLQTDSIELKVYVENSGSMDAYMCAGSNLKDAVFDYVSDAKKAVTSCQLYYINSVAIPYNGSLDAFIKDLTPASFARNGGNRKNTDLRAIFAKMLAELTDSTVIMFVSDCILDIPEDAKDFFGNCQISIKNTFNEAISKVPALGVQILKLNSKFEGKWYCGKNEEYLTNVKRPYYIWMIGNNKNLAEINKIAPVDNIIHGYESYCAYAPVQSIPYYIDKKRYAVNHSGTIDIEIQANLEGTLQSGLVIENNAQYTLANPSQVTVTSIKPITTQGSKYSHVISLQVSNPQTLKSETITFSYPYMPTWVEQSNDDSGTDIMQNLDKTTGIKYLITGVAEAFKDATTCGHISFKLSNK